MIGESISHYKIVEKLGQGGMGEVYLADDTTLDRKVALKFLPEAFTSDPERMARFEREAKLLASLNHPNIAGIYGLEQADGNRFLVLEYVEGETLQARLGKGALPLEDALALCRQIAEGLEAAHEKGVIHRDLKPANVMITSEEKVKILDFGLAKAFAGEQTDLNLSNSPTLSVAATQQGVILGTAAYMSPEQARGKEVDKRADIWAFGVVLFEMLTGKQVFMGDTVSDTLASVLAREPEWQSLPKNLHPRIRLLLERCLKKESKDRYRDIGDARVDIQEVLADPSNVLIQPVPSEESRAKFRTMIPWLAATLILGVVMAGFAVWSLRNPEPLKPIIHLNHNLRKGQRFVISHSLLDVSPDGTQIVYATNKGLYLRSLNDREAKPIPNERDYEMSPFFSPDGKYIGYLSQVDSQLKKIPTDGGAAIEICDVEEVLDPFWYTDNTIIFYDHGKGIVKVTADEGIPEPLISEEYDVNFPRILPDGKSIIYEAVSDGASFIFAQSLKSKETKRLFKGENAFYLKTGHLVYVFDYDIWVVPFDKEKLVTTGDHFKVIEGVWNWAGGPQFAVSNSGTLAYIPKPPSSERTLVWVDREGNEEEIPIQPSYYGFPKISPNGDRIALSIFSGGGGDISIFNLRNDQLSQVTHAGMDAIPFWDPDGQRIYYSSRRNGVMEIYSKKTDGSIEDDLVLHEKNKPVFVNDIFVDDNDAKTMIYRIGAGPNMDIAEISLEGESGSTPLLSNKYSEWGGKISPDGKWLAYESCKEGQYEIYICSYPDMDVNEKVSQGEGHDPLWSINGSEVFYRGEDYVMAVPIKTEPKLEPGKPEKLFNDIYAQLGDQMTWDIDPKGERFLMVKDYSGGTSKESTSSSQININFNWLEELKEKGLVD